MHSQNCRIFQRLWHGHPSQSGTTLCKLIHEYGQMHWGLAEPSQLQGCVELRPLARVEIQCCAIRPFKVASHGFTALLRFNRDEAPRLAIAHRRRQRGEANQVLDEVRLNRIDAEAANISSQLKQALKVLAKGLVEDSRVWLGWSDHGRLH